MLVNTAVLGEVEVKQEDIFALPEGLYGFESKGDYTIIKKQEDDITLMWLQAVDGRVPCFVVFDPFEVIDGYAPVVEKADLRFLECEDPSELVHLVIAVVPEDITEITVNLKSPVVINKKKGKGRQVILANKDYPMRFPLFGEDTTEKQEK